MDPTSYVLSLDAFSRDTLHQFQKTIEQTQTNMTYYLQGLLAGKDIDYNHLLQILQDEQKIPFGLLLKGENPSVGAADTAPSGDPLDQSTLTGSGENA